MKFVIELATKCNYATKHSETIYLVSRKPFWFSPCFTNKVVASFDNIEAAVQHRDYLIKLLKEGQIV